MSVREGSPPIETGLENKRDRDPGAGVLVYRAGTSANCSSVGSSVDLLFVTAAVGGAIFAAAMAALASSKVTIPDDEPPAPDDGEPRAPERDP